MPSPHLVLALALGQRRRGRGVAGIGDDQRIEGKRQEILVLPHRIVGDRGHVAAVPRQVCSESAARSGPATGASSAAPGAAPAPTRSTTAAIQNGATGCSAKRKPALSDPSACPRLPAAACLPSSAPDAARSRSSSSYDRTGPIMPTPVATTAPFTRTPGRSFPHPTSCRLRRATSSPRSSTGTSGTCSPPQAAARTGAPSAPLRRSGRAAVACGARRG